MSEVPTVALCGHYVRPGTPAEALLLCALARFDDADRATRATDPVAAGEAWSDARRLVREATDAVGYVGRAVDEGLVNFAWKSVGRADPTIAAQVLAILGADVGPELVSVKLRERLVALGLRAGLTEDVARRSVIEGLLRGANPPGGHRGGRAPTNPSPSWSDTLPPRCA